MREYDTSAKHIEPVYRALEDAGLLERDWSLPGLLRRVHAYARKLITLEALESELSLDPVTGMPSGLIGRIVLKEPSSAQKARGLISVDGLFDNLNATLKEQKVRVWVLFDRLDVAFTENHQLEANALRALIRSYADIRNQDNIALKIFLREDIWTRIAEAGMREHSHITRFVVLNWTPPLLLNLIMRRLLSNKQIVDEFGIDVENVLKDFTKQEELFDQLFPKQVEQGPQKATTFNWLITRCADGTEKTAPRELIQLLNAIRDQEIRRLEYGGHPPQGDLLFDRSVFKLALPTVSETRLNQYLYAEYPKERPFVESLTDQKAEQTLQSLADLWGVEQRQAFANAEELADLGFFQRRGTREQPTFWVPFLYRDALHLVQGRAEADEPPR